MKLKLGFLVSFLIFVIGCNTKKEYPETLLNKTFHCKADLNFNNLKSTKDIKNNFTIQLPENWKTNTYFDDKQSDIYTADTTKTLNSTYILNVSHYQEAIKLDQELVEKSNSYPNLELIFSEFEKFKGKPSYWHFSKGYKESIDYQMLNLYVKLDDNAYVVITLEIYGNENVQVRTCEAIQLINTIEFL